jgi:hypothetical protein
MHKVICLFLITAFLGATTMEARNEAASAAPPGQESTKRVEKLKEKILAVPTGTMIEVQLLNKQKVRGRLGQIDDNGFSLTTSQQGKIVTQNIAFTEVNSFRKLEGGKAGHRVVWMLAGIGILVVIGIVVWAAQIGNS